MNLIQQLFNALRLLPPFVERELKEQYAGSSLGAVWNIIQPLLFILLYWWIFATIMRVQFPRHSPLADTPFITFLLSALLPWFAFQEGLIRATNAIINRRDMVCKVHFPILVFPLAAISAAFIIHTISYLIFLISYMIWRGEFSITTWLAAILLLSLQLIITFGLGLFFAAITVYLRDIQQLLNLLLTVLFYTAPILYPITQVPAKFHHLIYFNPFTVLAESYHNAILIGTWPPLSTLLWLIVGAGISLTCGIFVFKRLEPGFTDIL